MKRLFLLAFIICLSARAEFSGVKEAHVEIAPIVNVAPQLTAIPLTANCTINADVQPGALSIETKFTKPLATIDAPLSIAAGAVTGSIMIPPDAIHFDGVQCNVPEGAIKISLTVNGPLLGNKESEAVDQASFIAAHWREIIAFLCAVVIFLWLERRRLAKLVG